MIPEIQEVFREVKKNGGDDFLISNCALKDATIIMVNEDGTIKNGYPFSIPDKIENIDDSDERLRESFFRYTHSFYLYSNKAVNSKDKKIFSVTKDSFILKLGSFHDEESPSAKQNPLLKDHIEPNYFKILIADEKKPDGFDPIDEVSTKKNLGWIMEHLTTADDKYLSMKCLADLVGNNIKKKGKDHRICIFFAATEEEVVREYDRYLIPNVYLESPVLVNNEQFFLSCFNMTMNSNKPFLTNKTRKCYLPYLLDIDSLLEQQEMFSYFEGLCKKGKPNIYVDTKDNKIYAVADNEPCTKDITCGYYLRMQNGKTGADILYVETINQYKTSLSEPFLIRNYTQVKIEKSDSNKDKKKEVKKEKQKYIEFTAPNGVSYETRKEVINAVYMLLFGTQKKGGGRIDYIWLDIKKMQLSALSERAAKLLQEPVRKWAYAGNCKDKDPAFYHALMEAIDLVIQNTFLYGRYGYGTEPEMVLLQFNLKWAVQEYFSKRKDEKNMGDIASALRESVRKKINSTETTMPENDAEYYYAAGQAVRYLLSLSQASSRNASQGILKDYMTIKSDTKLKRNINRLYRDYCHEISSKNQKACNLIAMIKGYIPDSPFDSSMFILGYCSRSIMYEKKGTENTASDKEKSIENSTDTEMKEV